MVLRVEESEKEKNTGVYSFEDALSLAGFGRYQIIFTMICGFGMIGMMIETAGMGFITPSAQCDLKLSADSKGLLNSMSLFGILSSSHLWGFLGDTKGRRKVLILPLTINILVNIVSSFSHIFWLSALLKFTAGFLVGSSVAVIFPYLSEFQTREYRSTFIIWGATFVSLTYIYMPCVAWIILPYDWELPIDFLGITYRPWRLLIVAYTFPNIVFVLGLLFFPESPAFLSEHDPDQTLSILKNIYCTNTGKSPETFPVKELLGKKEIIEHERTFHDTMMHQMWDQTASLFKAPLLKKTLTICSLQFGTFSTALGLYMSIPHMLNIITPLEEVYPGSTLCELIDDYRKTFPNETFNENCNDGIDEMIYSFSLTLSIPMYITYVIIAIILDKIGKKHLIVSLFAITGLGGVLLDFAQVQWLRLIFLCLFLLAVIGIGVVNTFAAQMFPMNHRAMAVAMSFIFGRLGAVIINNTINPLLKYNCRLTFALFGGELLVCALIALALPGDSSSKEKHIEHDHDPPVIINVIQAPKKDEVDTMSLGVYRSSQE